MIRTRSFTDEGPGTPLAELLHRLLEQQKRTWPQLASGYASLETVRIREIRCTGFSAWLQFNPGRIVSTGAKIDPQAIRERRCFLCLENLPDPQKGILYKDEFLILCNPAPIFAEHFTISYVRHVRQALGPYVAVLLDLARDLSPVLTVFYNGPKCGASAPDHMHFQASPTGTIPVEKAAQLESYRVASRSIDEVDILTIRDFGRRAIILESRLKENLSAVLKNLLTSLGRAAGSIEEPMVNLLCSFSDGIWRLIVFPRSKHRPDVFFREGAERVLISPAAVDIGGLIVTPMEKDFHGVTPAIVENIFEEVSLSRELVDEAIHQLS